MPRRLQCYAHGRTGDWEGLCVDLDIAVQGESFDEVKRLLDEAVRTYVEDAAKEAPETRRRLLARQAPAGLRLRMAASYLAHLAFAGAGREMKAGFDLPCPA